MSAKRSRASLPARVEPLDGWREGWTPDPDLTVSQWADEHRELSGKASSEVGRWSTARTPYLREIMDSLGPHDPVQRVAFMKGAQVGGTEAGNNWLGYIIAHQPAPTLLVLPTVNVAKRASKQRLAPMIEATPVLRSKVREARSRDSGNTTFEKEFEGGILILTGANSASGLRSMPIRFMFGDEVDEWPGDVEGQGDPAVLAERRTNTFSRRKIFYVSTPTEKGVSRIDREWERSDKRRYFVACPHCQARDWIRWENIRWDRDEAGEHLPDTARLLCTACGTLIDERHKTAMLAAGQWRATAKGDGTRGYHLSALYSPLGWLSWREIVATWLEAQRDPTKLKAFVNTILGEPWEERGEAVDAEGLKARLEAYPADLPDGVGAVVCTVDVQGDRLEAQCVGFGRGEQAWLIAHETLHGDPAQLAVWEDLDRFRRQRYRHANGRSLGPEVTLIDSGGHHTEAVYRYCRARLGQRVFALKGVSRPGMELVARASSKNRYRVKVFLVNVDQGKELLTARLRIQNPGPGYIHLPQWVDDEYLAQLTSEKRVSKWKPKRGVVREWIKTRERNEALDLWVYALAALQVLGRAKIASLAELAALVRQPAAAAAAAPGEGGATAPGVPAVPAAPTGFVWGVQRRGR